MYITCVIREINITHDKGVYKYVNRPINMDTVSTFDRSTCAPDRLGYELPTIKFTHARNHLSEWMFNNVTEREEVLNNILRHVGVKTMTVGLPILPFTDE